MHGEALHLTLPLNIYRMKLIGNKNHVRYFINYLSERLFNPFDLHTEFSLLCTILDLLLELIIEILSQSIPSYIHFILFLFLFFCCLYIELI